MENAYTFFILMCYRSQAVLQALAATQTPGEAGKRWFQGTADAVRQFHWLFEVFSVTFLCKIVGAYFLCFIDRFFSSSRKEDNNLTYAELFRFLQSPVFLLKLFSIFPCPTMYIDSAAILN